MLKSHILYSDTLYHNFTFFVNYNSITIFRDLSFFNVIYFSQDETTTAVYYKTRKWKSKAVVNAPTYEECGELELANTSNED